VVCEAEGGSAQIVNDTDSQTEFLLSTLAFTGLLVTTDAQALTLANLLLDRYSNPRTRVKSVTTDVGSNGAKWFPAIITDLGDKVRIIKSFEPGAYWPAELPFDNTIILQDDSDETLTTDGDVNLLADFGSILDANFIVQNIIHDISPSLHIITVGLSPVYS
jgi:hypothetical protein